MSFVFLCILNKNLCPILGSSWCSVSVRVLITLTCPVELLIAFLRIVQVWGKCLLCNSHGGCQPSFHHKPAQNYLISKIFYEFIEQRKPDIPNLNRTVFKCQRQLITLQILLILSCSAGLKIKICFSSFKYIKKASNILSKIMK